jgi:hypothetical protein
MRVAITFGNQTKRERGDDEYGYSPLRGREAKSLPHFIEFETPGFLNHIANPSGPLQLKAIT